MGAATTATRSGWGWGRVSLSLVEEPLPCQWESHKLIVFGLSLSSGHLDPASRQKAVSIQELVPVSKNSND